MNDNTIKTKDNRMFNSDGSLRDNNIQSEEQNLQTPSPQETIEDQQQTASSQESTEYSEQGGGSIDFATFILSLASSAQISMGVVPHPITGEQIKDLDHAKQSIDIISMLEEKTKNNLLAEESGMLRQVLYQLRMQYVQMTQR